MKPSEKILAEKLLNISAIQFQPESPFLLSTGWNSPIYPDIRKALSNVDVRTYIKIELSKTILENFGEVDAIAGVAKGAIAFAAITADALCKPFAFVRSTPKDHGLENMIEGNLKPGWKVVVIEDIVSTGAHAINAVEAIRNAGCEVVGLASVFNFEFEEAAGKFSKEKLQLKPLLGYDVMIEEAISDGYLSEDDVETLKVWRDNPELWTKE